MTIMDDNPNEVRDWPITADEACEIEWALRFASEHFTELGNDLVESGMMGPGFRNFDRVKVLDSLREKLEFVWPFEDEDEWDDPGPDGFGPIEDEDE